jgi:hypothetical protein
MNRPSKADRYTSNGGYPLYYVSAIGDCLCAYCTSDDGTTDWDGRQWLTKEGMPLGADVNWEAHRVCDNCGEEIETAHEREMQFE